MAPRGFSLLEVLIALVIFGIGMLGYAGLQLKNIQLSDDSGSRATAYLHANDIIDRMRANMTETLKGTSSAYNNPLNNATAYPSCLGIDTSGNENDSHCTNTQMAAHDFYAWHSQITGRAATNWHGAVEATLTNGTGVVCIDATPEDGTASNPACDNTVLVADAPLYAVKIFWTERKDAHTTARRFVMSFAP